MAGHADPQAEVDDKNIEYARRNVKKNELESRIQVRPVKMTDPLLKIAEDMPFVSLLHLQDPN
jgi:tRNA A22 N-methylase